MIEHSLLADELLADRLCDRLEAAWGSSQRPSIETLLAEAPLAARATVLEQLLRSEVGLRAQDGERPAIVAYLARFADSPALVKQVFDELQPPDNSLATADLATAQFVAGDTVEVKQGKEPQAEKFPRRFGDYELLAQLGVGGMGVVYKARHVTADRLVALKLVRPDQLASYSPEERTKLLARFRNEVQAAARLEHDHVVTVYDVGEIGGQSYYAMRLVDGDSLKDRLGKGPLEPEVAARYIEQVARALAEAHSHGILHRDLKPHNVMVDRRTDRALLTDFGLAKLAQQDQELTAHGAVFGSPPYMSPEQTIDAGNVTAASDIYGLGATLYHLLTGRPPFHAANPMATLHQVQTQDPTSPRVLNPAVPLDLETICLKCLEKKPHARFASAAELADRLARVLRGEPIPERPLSRQAKVWRWCKRNRTVATLSAGLVLLVLVIAVVSPIVAVHQYELAGNLEKSLGETKLARESEKDSLLRLVKSMDRNGDPNTRLRVGWKQQALDELKQSLPEDPDPEHRLAFRSIAADYATATDLVHVADLTVGEPMYCLAFDAKGKRLAMGRHQGIPGGLVTTVLVLDIATRAELLRTTFHGLPTPARPNGSRSIGLSPDGRWLAVGDRYGKVHVWDLSVEKPQGASFPAHGNETVSCVAFSPNGDLYTCGQDKWLRRWRPPTEKTGTFQMAAEVMFSQVDLHFSLLPDNEVLVTSDKPAVLSAETFQPIADAAPPDGWGSNTWRSASIGRANAMAVVQGLRLLLVDRETGKVLHEFRDPRGQEAVRADARIVQLSASADGTLLVTSDSIGYVKLWDVVTGRLISELPAGSPGSNAAVISPDGDYLAMTSEVENRICVGLWKIVGRELHRPLAVSPDAVRDFQVLRSGDLALLTAVIRQGRIVVDLIGRTEGELLRRVGPKIDYEGPPAVLAVDPTSPTLRHTGTGREVFSWNAENGKRDEWIDAPSIRLLEYSPDGACWCVQDSSSLGYWDGSTGFQPRWDNDAAKLTSGRRRIYALAAGNRNVAVGTADGALVLLRREGVSGLVEHARIDGRAPVTAVAFNSSESLLLFGTEQGKLGVVRLPAVEPGFIEAHANQVNALTFTSDGRRLVSAGDDQQLLLWDVDEQGRISPSLTLRPQLGPLAKVRFSPDDTQLYALAKGSFALHVWDLKRLDTEFAATFGAGLKDSTLPRVSAP